MVRFIYVLIHTQTEEVHFYDPTSIEQLAKSEGDLITLNNGQWLIDRILQYDLNTRSVINEPSKKQTNFEKFLNVYSEKLESERRANPDLYSWPLDELPKVIKRMSIGFVTGSFNKESKAIKETCKYFGIKHTYKAIAEFVKQD